MMRNAWEHSTQKLRGLETWAACEVGDVFRAVWHWGLRICYA
ncbi:hypothetical protein RBWH47_00202 [Rhodopirellula baltica WH47]|uniref:Uncharacterized protein n=1 Tax=Rhodopirellula baltica WH47 TaxID=991778 RepID=F2AR62_RHOBT|nr:hypothetical protein RBWH47_00202 [Rhodopirellula baltica WH47]